MQSTEVGNSFETTDTAAAQAAVHRNLQKKKRSTEVGSSFDATDKAAARTRAAVEATVRTRAAVSLTSKL